jgi:hypothetical protein
MVKIYQSEVIIPERFRLTDLDKIYQSEVIIPERFRLTDLDQITYTCR